MKLILIWWHRRRAQQHAAKAAHKRATFQGSPVFGCHADANESWFKWHLAQIERLNNK